MIEIACKLNLSDIKHKNIVKGKMRAGLQKFNAEALINFVSCPEGWTSQSF